jgi:hypothetical protein
MKPSKTHRCKTGCRQYPYSLLRFEDAILQPKHFKCSASHLCWTAQRSKPKARLLQFRPTNIHSKRTNQKDGPRASPKIHKNPDTRTSPKVPYSISMMQSLINPHLRHPHDGKKNSTTYYKYGN